MARSVIRSLLLLLAILAFAAPPAAAAKAPMRQFRDGEKVAIRADAAYLLFRTDARMDNFFDFVFLREDGTGPAPPAAQPRLDDAGSDANLFRSDSRDVYAKTADSRFFLLEVPAGSYVVALVTFKRMAGAGTCLCMGTVRFDAKPGMVTDLGTFLAELEDRPSKLPELAAFTNPPTPYRVAPALAVMTVRPPLSAAAVPDALKGATLVAADYRAVGKFPNWFHTMINRMAPVAGVLAYELDRAVDLKAAAH